MAPFRSSKVIRQLPDTNTLHSLRRAGEPVDPPSGCRVTDEVLHGLGQGERGKDTAHAPG